MKTKITYIIILLLTTNFGYGQTILSAGDIAITGVNSSNPDQFSFVILNDILNNTKINFTDLGWQSSGVFNTPANGGSNEGVVTWTATSDLPCGTEIIITNTGSSTYSATLGASVQSDAGFSLSSAGDQLIAFQGSVTTPTHLYAISFGSLGADWTDATSSGTSAVPLGLTDGFDAIFIGNINNASYNCSTTNNASLILSAVSNSDNWAGTNAGTRPALTTCTFTSCSSTCSSPAITWTSGGWTPSTPDINTPVTIAFDYNTGIDGNFSACSIIVNNGFNLTVNNGDYIEVENDVTVDGQLFVETQGNFVQNNNFGSFTDNSTNGVQVTKTKIMTRKFAYTYWSSPVTGETIEQTFGNTPGDRRFYFNATNFIDVLAEIGNTNTFNLGQDDIDDDGNDWQRASGIMQTGVGYTTTASEFGPAFPRSESFVFRGAFNNGVIQLPLINNSGGVYNDWNFIGNPYPSAISVDLFFSTNTGLVDVIYLWDQATPESNTAGGSQGYNFSADDYAIINGTGQIGARGNTGTQPSRYISSGQGFFVEALSSGNITFNNTMRVIDNNTLFFKTNNSKESKLNNSNENKLWINISSNNGISNQILVGYVDGASKNLDASYYDAPRNLSTNVLAILYSNIENSSKKFAIQGKAPSDLNENEIINLGFKTSINVETLYTLSIAQLQGDFLNSNTVYFKDNLLNIIHNLSDSDYNFTSEVGEFNNRFEIAFNMGAFLSTDDILLNENNISIIELENDRVQFKTNSNSNIKTITIFDLLGRRLYNLKGNNSIETYRLSNLSNIVFIAKIELSNGAIITKKAIKK
jgi:hypothetical protein